MMRSDTSPACSVRPPPARSASVILAVWGSGGNAGGPGRRAERAPDWLRPDQVAERSAKGDRLGRRQSPLDRCLPPLPVHRLGQLRGQDVHLPGRLTTAQRHQRRDGPDDDTGQCPRKPPPSKGITRLTVSPPSPDDGATQQDQDQEERNPVPSSPAHQKEICQIEATQCLCHPQRDSTELAIQRDVLIDHARNIISIAVAGAAGRR
jgi:hypothetical protein